MKLLLLLLGVSINISNPAKPALTRYHQAYSADRETYGNLSNISMENSTYIYGGIVSHHLLMAKDIAKFYAAIKSQKPNTIVLIGPNHFNTGKGNILISKYGYQTPWGNIEPNTGIIEKLKLRNEEDPFEQEHSISAEVSFIKYFLPEAQIVPIIIKRNTTKSEAKQLGEALYRSLGNDVVVLASVDFSHHISTLAAQFHDEMSQSAINNFDYDRIYKTEIDSPAAITATLKYLELKGAQKMESARKYSAETSYLFAKFYKGNYVMDNRITILSFGDMMLGRGVAAAMTKGLNPFEKIRGVEGNFLRGADVITANLEGPITEYKDCIQKEYSFRFEPVAVTLLKKNGITTVNLANNHALDCRENGLADTRKYLKEYEIGFFGKNINWKKENITVYGFENGFIQIDKNTDYAAANIHWGNEYQETPSTNQRDVGHRMVDKGVDLVIGHHPHVIQPLEIYKDKAIFYSLGNFIFDQKGEKQNQGLAVGTVLNKNIYKYYIFPYKIVNYQPELLNENDAENFCKVYLKDIPNSKRCYFEINQ